MEFKYEKNKRNSRTSNSIRSICIALCFALLIGINPIYANSVDITVPGNLYTYFVQADGTIDGHMYNGNNALTNYFSDLSHSLAFLGKFAYQNGTYLATIYTYFSAALNDIKTYSYNTAAATNAALTFLGSIENKLEINWQTASTFQGVTTSFGGQFWDMSSSHNNQPASQSLYFYFNALNIAGENFYRITLPLRASAQNNLNKFISNISIMNSSGSSTLTGDFSIEYDYLSNRVYVYLQNYVPFTQSYPLVLKIDFINTYNVYYSITPVVEYLSNDTVAYLLKNDNLYLRSLAHNGIQFDDSDIIDAINSIHMTDNDITLNVTYNNSDTQDVDNIIPFIRSFFDNGYGTTNFISQSNTTESNWFSQGNKDLIDNLSEGYVDLYD